MTSFAGNSHCWLENSKKPESCRVQDSCSAVRAPPARSQGFVHKISARQDWTPCWLLLRVSLFYNSVFQIPLYSSFFCSNMSQDLDEVSRIPKLLFCFVFKYQNVLSETSLESMKKYWAAAFWFVMEARWWKLAQKYPWPQILAKVNLCWST